MILNNKAQMFSVWFPPGLFYKEVVDKWLPYIQKMKLPYNTIEDFMNSQMGRAIVANSTMQILLKQSPSAVDVLGQVFKLTEEELNRLATFPVGQGLLFAGPNHVLLQVIASETETNLITTNPNQM